MKLFFILIVLFPYTGFAQPYETNPDNKRVNHWFFGDSIWLDFNYNPPVSKSGSQLSAIEPSTSYSDEDGNLLLYSDGLIIWNRNHNIILNGTGIDGHESSSQGAVFVKSPDNDSIVYLFTTDRQCNNKGLKYSKIKLYHNPDSIVVMEKNISLITNVTESISVTNHRNNKDVWVVVHSGTGNTFYSFLLTKDGVVKCPVETSIGYNFDGHIFNCQTKSKFNNKGDVYAINVFFSGNVQLYSFDKSNGTFDNFIIIEDVNIPTGVAFTANDSFLYFVERNNSIRRFNVSSQKHDTIHLIQNNQFFIIGILNANNILYMNILDSNHLAVIHNVESDSPVFNLHGLSVGNKRLTNGLPNFNTSYSYIPSINIAMQLNCVSNTIQFYGHDTFSATSYDWFISKQGSTSIASNTKDPIIEFEDTGIYLVRYIASNGSRTDTVTKEVTIYPKIEKNFLGNDTGWCNAIGSPIAFEAPNDMHCYEWNTGETNSQITVDTSGIYIAKVTTPNFCVTYDTVVVSIDTLESTINNFLGEDKYWCENIDTFTTLKALDGFDSYKWNNGSTKQQILTNVEGVYYVEAFKRNQCSNGGNIFAYDTIEIILLNAPDKPTLNRILDSLFTNVSGNISYIWYHNNILLSDTTSYLILPDTGTYYLKVINGNNCVNYSDTIHVATLSIDNVLFNNIKVYPNPTNGVFNIDVSNELFAYTIHNFSGKAIKDGHLVNGSNQIDLRNFPNGVYFITIKNNNQISTLKLIKIE